MKHYTNDQGLKTLATFVIRQGINDWIDAIAKDDIYKKQHIEKFFSKSYLIPYALRMDNEIFMEKLQNIFSNPKYETRVKNCLKQRGETDEQILP